MRLSAVVRGGERRADWPKSLPSSARLPLVLPKTVLAPRIWLPVCVIATEGPHDFRPASLLLICGYTIMGLPGQKARSGDAFYSTRREIRPL